MNRVLLTVVTAAVVFALPASSVCAAPVEMADGSLFDASFYARRYPDVVEFYATEDPSVMYQHYLTFGKAEGRLAYAGAKPAADASAQTPVAAASDKSTDQVAAAPSPEPAQTTETLQTAASTQTPAKQPAPQKSPEPTPARPPVSFPTFAHAKGRDAGTFYSRAVFIGDSVMVGYRNYLAGHRESPVSAATFLAAHSYSARHALNENDSLHPAYRGKKQPVWKTIAQMDVDRVFLMFGTNDLVVKDAPAASADVLALADRIRENNPGKEIHLISMSPVYAGVSKGALNNPTINDFNLLLRQGANERGMYYIELNAYLKNANDALEPRYCSDRYVHQTAVSYAEVWDPLFTAYAGGAD